MFTPTRLFYIICGAVGGAAAGGYVAWAIASRFARIAELNDRAIVEPHVLVALCVAGGLIAFPLGAAAGNRRGIIAANGNLPGFRLPPE